MKRILLTLVCFSAISITGLSDLIAQNVLSGNVTDAQLEEPLIGATVFLKGTQTGTVTDVNGDFTINSDADTGTIVFSFVGYLDQEMSFSGSQTINVALTPDLETLEEVVVVAYGTQKKSHLTGAVASLKNEGLDEIAVSRADQALQGKLAGVQILNTDPQAGSKPSIRIRGNASISASSDPLIVIDGYPIPKGEDGFSMVSMGDVESVEVLKDAASSALYGSRAAGGVILITTKSGSEKKTNYSFKMYTGISQPIMLPEVKDNIRYVEDLYAEGELRMLDPAVDGDRYVTERFYDVTDNEKLGYLYTKHLVSEPTNWIDEALRDYGSINSYQLSASGGGEKMQYFLSGNYNSEKGIMERSDYQKLSVRTKVDVKLSEKFRVGINFSPAYSKRERPNGDLTDYIRFHNYIPVYHTEATAAFTGKTVGEYAQVQDFYDIAFSGIGADGTVWHEQANRAWTTGHQNPVSQRERSRRIDDRYMLSTNGYLDINILEGLTFRTSLGVYYSYNEYNFSKKTSAESEGEKNELEREMTTVTDLLSESILSYDKSFGDHNLNFIAGFTAQQTQENENSILGRNFPDEERMSFNMATDIDKNGTSSYYYKSSLLSYLGRVTYDYKGKYLASVALRADGSSRFAPGNQWGTFPSASVGWRVSEEPFLKGSNTLSNLKIRASYGLTGNNEIPRYAYMDILSTRLPDSPTYPDRLREKAKDYSLGGDLFPGMSATEDALGNPELTWEKLEEINLGIDLGFIQNRYNISVEYYDANSIDLLLTEPAMYITGHQSAWDNIGKVNNEGIEVEVKANLISRSSFTWIVTGNISKNKNTLVDYGSKEFQIRIGERTDRYIARVGEESIQFYGYKTDGVWTSYDEVNAAIADTSFIYSIFAPEAGGLKVVDTDGNDTVNTDDRVVIGSPFPDFTWGITNSFTYRNFDASFLIQGSQGGELINGDARNLEPLRKYTAYTENRWVSPMFPGDGQTTYNDNTAPNDLMATDYVVEDASYIALREVMIGYTLPTNIANKIFLNNVRAYVAATNLLYFMGKDYRGTNPEARRTSSEYDDPLVAGYQRGVFPVTRTFTFGLDISF